MLRNVAAKIQLFAFDTTTGAAKTGDAANITAYVAKDGGAVTVLADTSASEMEATNAKGWYQFDLAQGETDAVDLLFTGKSSTANISVVGRPVTTAFPQTGDNFARLGAPAGASVSADIAAAKVDTAAIKVKTDFLPSATAGAAGGVFIAGSNAATSITTALTANVIGDVTGNLSGSVGSVTAGVTLAASAVQAIWDALTSALTTVGSIGKLLVDRLAVLARIDTTLESTGSPTDYVFTVRALAQAPSGTGASAVAIADEVQTRTIAGVTLVATTTNLTNAPTNGDLTATMKTSVTTAATAATPIAASVTGAVGSVTGNVGGNVTGSVGSVVGAVGSVTAGVTVTTNNDKTGYALSTAGNAAAADKILVRNLAGGLDGTRTVQDALRSLRNKTSIAAGTLTVTQEDDTTPAWTAVVTTTAGDPLSSIDPA